MALFAFTTDCDGFDGSNASKPPKLDDLVVGLNASMWACAAGANFATPVNSVKDGAVLVTDGTLGLAAALPIFMLAKFAGVNAFEKSKPSSSIGGGGTGGAPGLTSAVEAGTEGITTGLVATAAAIGAGLVVKTVKGSSCGRIGATAGGAIGATGSTAGATKGACGAVTGETDRLVARVGPTPSCRTGAGWGFSDPRISRASRPEGCFGAEYIAGVGITVGATNGEAGGGPIGVAEGRRMGGPAGGMEGGIDENGSTC